MKKFLISVVVLLGFSSSALADQFYAEVFGGATFNPDLGYGCCDFDMDTGYNVGGSLGTVINSLAMEGEILYTESDYSDYRTSLSATTIMFNLIYGFPLANTVEAYAGVGAGIVNVDYDGADQFPAFSGDDWVFGGQVIAGILFPVAENVDLFAEYRYQHAAEAEIQGVDNIEYRGHLLSGGLRFEF